MEKLYGNAIVGQSGGPTAAINATLAGVIRGAQTARDCGEMETLYGMFNGIEGFLREDFCDLLTVFDEEQKISDLIHTPAAVLGSCRKKLPSDPKDEMYDRIFSLFSKHNIRYFFYIGGNDSMDTVAKLSRASAERDYEICLVGVPKTIDNDLDGTDHTPGFGSAAKYIATTVEEIIRDCSVYTVPAVTVVEVMGRDAGWLTAASALPSLVFGEGPDLVYVPERVFDVDAFLSDVKAALARHPNVVVTVSEGVRNAAGEYVGSLGQSGTTDVFGHKYLAGTGKVLEQLVREHIGCKVRAIELSLPQRCAGHLASATDLAESVRVGQGAVQTALEGGTGCVVTILRNDGAEYGITIGHSDVNAVANRVRTLPETFVNEAGNGVTEECLRYLLPLIQGEDTPRYVDGLPYQFKLR